MLTRSKGASPLPAQVVVDRGYRHTNIGYVVDMARRYALPYQPIILKELNVSVMAGIMRGKAEASCNMSVANQSIPVYVKSDNIPYQSPRLAVTWG
jgi:hypothetical protein